MFDKGKRAQRHDKEDAAFNRMLLWLAGAVVLELILLLVKRAYVNLLLGPMVAMALVHFFTVFRFLGAALTAAGAVWAVLSLRGRKPVLLPCICTAVAGGLWVLSVFAYYLSDVGLNIVMILPAAAAVLIVIFFLYQRAFFLNAMLAGGGLAALWLYRQYYADHPRMITVFFVAGFVVLAVAAVLFFLLRQNDGRLGSLQILPSGSNYAISWITCAVTAIAMALALALGLSAAYYLLFILLGWVFIQAVFFTVKLM